MLEGKILAIMLYVCSDKQVPDQENCEEMR